MRTADRRTGVDPEDDLYDVERYPDPGDPGYLEEGVGTKVPRGRAVLRVNLCENKTDV